MEIDRFVDGAFCWAEAGVPDVAAAKAFYSAVLGWSFVDIPLPDGGVYPMAKVGGRDVGAVFKLMNPAMPPAWSLYVRTSDVDETVRRVEAGGGKVIVPAMDVMEEGRMAVFSDPTGAVLSAWQPKRHNGFGRMFAHGAPCWFELMTSNLDVAHGFYRSVFDWESAPSKNAPSYIEVTAKGAPNSGGGLMAIDPAWGPMPSNWAIYFAVDDVDATLALVKSNGGTVVMGPKEIPHVGTFAILKDPGGAHFNVIKLTGM
jgi:predicted enzyme related to lactoylglutathione lyase